MLRASLPLLLRIPRSVHEDGPIIETGQPARFERLETPESQVERSARGPGSRRGDRFAGVEIHDALRFARGKFCTHSDRHPSC